MRQIFFAAWFKHVLLLWPIFSGILGIMFASGAVIGYVENWRMGESMYFTFVTGLTIGYGDLVPKHAVSRLLALLVGLCGIVLTGVVAAVTVQALNATDPDPTEQKDTSGSSSP